MSGDVADVGIPAEVLDMEMKKEKRRLTAQKWRDERKNEVEVLKQRVVYLEGLLEEDESSEQIEQMREQLETALARQRELQGELEAVVKQLEAVVKQRDRAIRERDDARRECTSLEEEMDSMLKNAGKCEECGRDI